MHKGQVDVAKQQWQFNKDKIMNNDIISVNVEIRTENCVLDSELAFEGGKWGDRPRPRSDRCPQTGKNCMDNEKKLNSRSRSALGPAYC